MKPVLDEAAIAEALDLTPYDPVQAIIDDESDVLRAEEVTIEDNDSELARKNIRHLILAGTRSFKRVLQVADNSQDAKAYDAAANFMGVLLRASNDLMHLQKQEAMLRGGSSDKGTTINHNTLNVTTAELQKLLKREE